MNERQYVQGQNLGAALAHVGILPRDPRYDRARAQAAELEAVVRRVQALAATQGAAVRQRRQASEELEGKRRRVRVAYLMPTARRAKRFFRDEPTVLNAMRLPPTRGTLDEHAACALAMVKALRPHAAALPVGGFPKGLLADLKATGKQLREHARQGEAARARLSQATREMVVLIRDARSLVLLIAAEVASIDHTGNGRLGVVAKQWAGLAKLGKKLGRPRKGRRPKDPGSDHSSADR